MATVDTNGLVTAIKKGNASVTATVIALITISARSIKTANSNPVNAIKYE